MSNHEQCKLGWNDLDRNDQAAARAHFAQVLARDANYASALHGMAMVELAASHHRDAEVFFRRALERDNRNAEIHFQFARLLLANGRRDEALATLRRAIRINPKDADSRALISTVLRQKNLDAESLTQAIESLRLGPLQPLSFAQLALTFATLGDAPTAADAARRGIAMHPDVAMLHVTLANAQRQIGDIDGAIASLRNAIEMDANLLSAHANLGQLLLLVGKCEEGWREDDWRLRLPTKGLPADITSPRWDGVARPGATLIIQAEQGIGDSIQFIRFAPAIAKLGMRVVVRCREPLVELLRTVEGVEEVVAEPNPPPAHDVHIPMMSLAGVMGIDLTSIPSHVPYLKTDPIARAHWQKRLADLPRPHVGIAWAGNPEFFDDRQRSPSPAVFAPLASVPGVSWISLQVMRHGKPLPPLPLHDFTSELKQLTDTAALIESLDLVISSDTSIPHIAGALARPVWTLLPFAADWRWLLDRADSPWYPTMQLFRQRTPGDWAGVINDVASSLGAFKASFSKS